MRITTIIIRAAILNLCLVGILSGSYGQSIHPLEPVSRYYKTYGSLSASPNPQRAWMDTITFPWAEYSPNAITNSLVRTVYLKPEDEAKLPGLIRPPANSSDQTRAELDYLLSLQNSRTKEQIDRAQFIANIGSWFNILNPTDPDYHENKKQLFYIAEGIGDWYNYQNFPATTQLLLNCIQDIRVTEFRLKWNFKRARPYHLEPKLQPLTRIKSPSFASGHTLWAFTQAFLFSEIIPEKRQDFINKADEVRWSRELMSIHYPSDNEASRIIAWNLVKFWYNNPQFVKDLNKAKEEWKSNKH
ncbi:MAG TPA: phosphatase PAP2 family protein [Chitinophagaceae bacterium]|jgi:acid phosphatase (class A)|nr:phosphatase PAP2 family protein [Chitinophagaceae bacterium]